MIGGDLSFASGGYGSTALRDVLPVELPPSPPTLEGENDANLTTDLFKPRLTPEGRTHPVTSLLLDPRENEARWAQAAAARRASTGCRARKPNAATLLAHPTLKGADGKPAPVLVVGDAGKGRVAGAADRHASGTGASRRPARGTTAAPSSASGRTRSAGWCAIRRSRCCASSSNGRSTGATSRSPRGSAPCTPTTSPAANVEVERRRRRRRQRARRQAAPQPAGDHRRRRRGPGRARRAAARRLPADRARDARRTRGHRRTRPSWCAPGGPELDDVAARDRVLRELAQASGGDYHVRGAAAPDDPPLARRPRRAPADRSRSGRARCCCCSASRC